jgi:hypothetical protein
MFRRLHDTVSIPIVENAIRMTKQLGLKVSKTGIRNLFFSQFKDSEQITLPDFQSVMEGMAVKTFAAKVPVRKLAELSTPFMILFSEKDEAFSVVHKVTKNWIQVFDPREYGLTRIPISKLQSDEKYLVVLVDTYDLNFVEENHQENIALETTICETYIRQIEVYDHFFSAEECDRIIDFSEKKNGFERSMVYYAVAGKADYSVNRTSSGVDLDDYPGIEDLIGRVCGVLGADRADIDFQGCIRYKPGQRFRLHYDAYEGGRRRRSMVLYLNDDFTGGETYFPEIDHKVTPQKGTCIIFPDINDQQLIITESLHASIPVVHGIKYIIPVFENLKKKEKVIQAIHDV